MKYESRAVSLFALRSLSHPRYSRLVARISYSLSRRSSGRDFRAKESARSLYLDSENPGPLPVAECSYVVCTLAVKIPGLGLLQSVLMWAVPWQ